MCLTLVRQVETMLCMLHLLYAWKPGSGCGFCNLPEFLKVMHDTASSEVRWLLVKTCRAAPVEGPQSHPAPRPSPPPSLFRPLLLSALWLIKHSVDIRWSCKISAPSFRDFRLPHFKNFCNSTSYMQGDSRQYCLCYSTSRIYWKQLQRPLANVSAAPVNGSVIQIISIID